MISNGGCDPFHYLKGNGALGYKPSPPYMHGLGYDYNLMDGMGIRGSMSMGNPMFKKRKDDIHHDYDTEEHLFDMENPPIILGNKLSYYKESNFQTGFNENDVNNVVNTNDEFLNKLNELEEKGETKKAYDICINELADLEDIKRFVKKYDDNYIDNPKYKYANQLEKYFTKRAEDLAYEYGKSHEDIETEVLEDTSNKTQNVPNKYKEVKDITSTLIKDPVKHKLHEETGNVYEDVLKLRPKALSSVDGDKSKPVNSKEIKGYSNEFQKFLRQYFNNLPEDDKAKFKDSAGRNSFSEFLKSEDGLLQYFPVDILKKNTIWEIKTHSDNKQKYQPYAVSKIKGYYGLGNPIYNIVYSKKNGRERLDNITFTYTDPTGKMKTINTLPKNDKGYNYFTNFNTEYGLAYYNALNDEDFTKEKIYDPTYLQGENYIPKMMDDFYKKDLNNKSIVVDQDNNNITPEKLGKYLTKHQLDENQIKKLLNRNFGNMYKAKYAASEAVDINKNSSQATLRNKDTGLQDIEVIDGKKHFRILKKKFDILPQRLQEKYVKRITQKQQEKIGKKY
jgi:hypothetical protein